MILDIWVPISDPGYGGHPSPYTNLGNFLGNLAAFGMIIAAILSFVYLIVGGFNYITSGGDKIQMQTSRERITYAIIGLAIVAGAVLFAEVLSAVLGINIFGTIKFPGP